MAPSAVQVPGSKGPVAVLAVGVSGRDRWTPPAVVVRVLAGRARVSRCAVVLQVGLQGHSFVRYAATSAAKPDTVEPQRGSA